MSPSLLIGIIYLANPLQETNFSFYNVSRVSSGSWPFPSSLLVGNHGNDGGAHGGGKSVAPHKKQEDAKQSFTLN